MSASSGFGVPHGGAAGVFALGQSSTTTVSMLLIVESMDAA
jgi:hypothetical protein